MHLDEENEEEDEDEDDDEDDNEDDDNTTMVLLLSVNRARIPKTPEGSPTFLRSTLTCNRLPRVNGPPVKSRILPYLSAAACLTRRLPTYTHEENDKEKEIEDDDEKGDKSGPLWMDWDINITRISDVSMYFSESLQADYKCLIISGLRETSPVGFNYLIMADPPATTCCFLPLRLYNAITLRKEVKLLPGVRNGAKYDVEEVWLIVTARWNKCHTAGVSLGAIKRDSFNSSVKDLST
ncbi:hypothetical protein V1477_005108 [Vespula maculifrons]|uniref:Uncharacterized protein n=1 Tax=Vespula maculifrons TaxID=7453 RepID=A0ABD2CNP7_VESMC